MLLRTLQGTVAEPSGHWWRVTSGFHTTGEESATAPPPPRREGGERRASFLPPKPAESGGQRYSWRLYRYRRRGEARGKQGNGVEVAAFLPDTFSTSEPATFLLKGTLWP